MPLLSFFQNVLKFKIFFFLNEELYANFRCIIEFAASVSFTLGDRQIGLKIGVDLMNCITFNCKFVQNCHRNLSVKMP